MQTDNTYYDLAHIPSPIEIEDKKSNNGEWNRHDLALWGVSWPPPSDWKDELINAHKSGFTVGVILECIGCRKARYFVDYEDYPVCEECREYEKEKYDREHQDIREIVQHSTSSFRSKPKKEPIPNELRWAVFERDNFTRKHCGSRRNLSIDHIVPESKGGQLTMENTQTLCKPCNSRKGVR